MLQHQLDDIFYLSVKLILKNEQNQILLLKVQKDNDSFWELPGGKVQIAETEEIAIVRELFEETGITSIQNLKHITTFKSDYRSEKKDIGYIFSFFSANTTQKNISLGIDHIEYLWTEQEHANSILNDAYVKTINELTKINV